MRTFRILISLLLLIYTPLESVSAVNFPTAIPTGEVNGGIFSQYFRNAVENPCPANSYMVGLSGASSTYMMPDCLTFADISVYASGIIGGTEGYLTRFGSGGSGLVNSIFFETGGRIGLGNTDPGAELEITGRVKITGGSPGLGKVLVSDVSGLATWSTPGMSVLSGAVWTLSGNDIGPTDFIGTLNGQDFRIYTNNSQKMVVDTAGNVGIGVASPGAKLEVNGQVKITGGSPGNGKILSSDATGLASWSTPSSLFDSSSITFSGTNMYIPRFTSLGSLTDSTAYQSGSDFIINGVRVGKGGGNIADNTAIGTRALTENTTGDKNLAVGYEALTSNTTGSHNTAVGGYALTDNIDGIYNTALGKCALCGNTGGSYNTAIGTYSMYANQADLNTAVGFNTLYNNVTGYNNVAIGPWALYTSSGGIWNIAIGTNSLYSNRDTYHNIGIGVYSLYSNTTGYKNIAIGSQSMFSNEDGYSNIAIGLNSMYNNTSGHQNTAIGDAALGSGTTGYFNTAIGNYALSYNTTGYGNTALGRGAGSLQTSGDRNIYIGDYVQANISNSSSNQLNIGDWIYGYNGNIGIGASNPGAKLEVAGQVKITGGSPGFNKVLVSDADGLATWQNISGGAGGVVTELDPVWETNSGTTWRTTGNAGTTAGTNFVGTTDAVDLVFKTDSTERMLVGSGGNVGIGTSSPSERLSVAGGNVLIDNNRALDWKDSTGTTRRVLMNSASNDVHLGHVDTGWGNNTYIEAGGAIGLYTNGVSSRTQTMLLTASGTVGIGVVYPGYTLDLSGSLRVGSGSNFLYDAGYLSYKPAGVSCADGEVLGWNNTLGAWVCTVRAQGITGSGLTTNYLTKWNGLDLVNSVTYESGGNLGIGTTNPIAKLDINGDIRSTDDYFINTENPTLFFQDTNQISGMIHMNNNYMYFLSGDGVNSANWGIHGSYWPIAINMANDDMVFGGNTYIMEGNLGIGTTTPGARFTVSGGTIQIVDGTEGAGKVLTSNASGVATWSTPTATLSGAFWSMTGNTVSPTQFLGSTNNEDLRIYTNNTERMLVGSGGNVGIGTSTPGAKLDVAGAIRFSNVAGQGGEIGRRGSDGGIYIASQLSTAGVAIATNGTDRVYVSSGGNVGIDTSSPSERLSVAGGNVLIDNNRALDWKDSTGTTRRVLLNSASNDVHLGHVDTGWGNNTYIEAGGAIGLYTNGVSSRTQTMLLTASGTVGIGVVYPGYTLDLSGSLRVGSGTNFTVSGGYLSYRPGNSVCADGEVLGWNNSLGAWVCTVRAQGITGSGLTANYVPKWNGLDLVNSLTYDNGTNIGIGTSSPVAPLTIKPTVNNQAQLAVLDASGSTRVAAYTDLNSRGILRIFDDTSTVKINLDSNPFVSSYIDSGNFGIGTTAPGQKLTVSGGTIQIINGSQGAGKVLVSDASGVATWSTPATTLSGAFWSMTGNTVSPTQFLGSTNNEDLRIYTNNIQRMVVGSGGNVGINTTNPTSTLEVNGSVELADGYNLTWGGAYGAGIPTIAGNVAAGGSLRFYPAGSTLGDIMRITGSGNVGIGLSSPNYNLDVAGSLRVGSSTNFTVSGGYLSYKPGNTTCANGEVLGWNNTLGAWVCTVRAQGITGSGLTTNYLTKWNGLDLVNSILFESGGNIGVGTASPGEKLEVAGNIKGTRFIGYGAGNVATNSAVGISSLASNTTGGQNTANGAYALASNTIGDWNTAVGYVALNANTTGNDNVAVGAVALFSNTGGNNNIAIGNSSLRLNTTGSNNVAIGTQTLNSNTTGYNNTALGFQTLSGNTTGVSNTAIGLQSLYANSTGSYNTALGQAALMDLTTGISNTALGYNTALGITTGSNNTIIGANVTGLSSNLSNNIIIADGSGNRRINVDSSGNVGIGTTAPGQKLTVSGGTIQIINGSQGAGKVLVSDASGVATWSTPATTLSGAFWSMTGNTVSPTQFLGSTNNEDLRIYTNNIQRMVVGSGGNVGIGTSTPGQKLTISGSIQIIDGNQSAGKFLLSDASGVASWAAISAYETDPLWSAASGSYYTKTNVQTSGQASIHFANLTNVPVASTTASGLVRLVDSYTGTSTSEAPTANAVNNLKNYTDALVAGLSWKQAVRVATTANITLSGLQSIDGYTTVAGDRVLVKNQSTATQNGIYIAAAGAWTRATDADASTEFESMAVYVSTGTTNKTNGWVLSNEGAITLGTTALSYVQFSGNGSYVGSAPIQISGNTISISQATASTGGYLSSADWTTFNNKFGSVTSTGGLKTVNTTALSLKDCTTNGQILIWSGSINGWTCGNDSNGVVGGQANYSARWLTSTTLGTGALYDNGTNVGINTTAPGYTLDLSGSLRVGTGTNFTVSGGYLSYKPGNTSCADGQVLGWDNTNNRWICTTRAPGITGSGLTTNYVTKWNGTDLVNSNLFESGGSVGIGTTSPSVKLDVTGQVRTTGNIDIDYAVSTDGLIVGNGRTSDAVIVANMASGTGDLFALDNAGVNKFRIMSSGSLQIRDGTQGSGKILASDASGVASWQTPASYLSGSFPVISVFGRTGAVVAVSGDYTASQITNVPAGNIAATNVQTALNELDTEKQPLIATGTTLQYYRGDKTWATLDTSVVPENTNLYFTNARAIAAPLTGFVASAGTVTSSDTILQAFQKLQGTDTLQNTNIATITGQIVTINSNIATATGDIASLSGRLNTTNANLATATGQIATLQTNLNTATGNIATITGQIVTINSNIATATGDIASLSGRVNTLSGVVDTKAPLASPLFTGDPRAPTPLTSDNDTSIATTAFVKAQAYLTGETDPLWSAASGSYYTKTNVQTSGQAAIHFANLTNVPVASTTASGLVRLVDSYTGTSTSEAPTANAVNNLKNYTDALVAGLSWKQAVRVATTANITLSGLQSIDGYTTVAGDRVLVKNQTTQTQNGIYIAAAGAWTRATDADSSTELEGAAVYVSTGSTYQTTGWVVSNAGAITLGTTNISFSQFSGNGSYVASAPIQITGNTISISQATASTGGYLSSTDWTTFNNKFGSVTSTGGLKTVNTTALSLKDCTTNGQILIWSGSINGWTCGSDAIGLSGSGLTTNYLTKWSGSAIVNSTLFDNGTNIGIGTVSPGQKLTISGGTIQIIDGNQGAGKILVSDASGVASWSTPASYLSGSFWSMTGNIVSPTQFLGSTNNEDLRIYTNNTQRMVVGSGGNVGIGTATPGQKLTVAGSVQIIDGTQGAGKVLTSDASGVATWTATNGNETPVLTTTLFGENGDLPLYTASTSPVAASYPYTPFGGAVSSYSCPSGTAKYYKVLAHLVDTIAAGGQNVALRIDFPTATDIDLSLSAGSSNANPNYRTWSSAYFQTTSAENATVYVWINGSAGPSVTLRKAELMTYCR